KPTTLMFFGKDSCGITTQYKRHKVKISTYDCMSAKEHYLMTNETSSLCEDKTLLYSSTLLFSELSSNIIKKISSAKGGEQIPQDKDDETTLPAHFYLYTIDLT